MIPLCLRLDGILTRPLNCPARTPGFGGWRVAFHARLGCRPRVGREGDQRSSVSLRQGCRFSRPGLPRSGEWGGGHQEVSGFSRNSAKNPTLLDKGDTSWVGTRAAARTSMHAQCTHPRTRFTHPHAMHLTPHQALTPAHTVLLSAPGAPAHLTHPHPALPAASFAHLRTPCAHQRGVSRLLTSGRVDQWLS